jgi:hypothetical protein
LSRIKEAQTSGQKYLPIRTKKFMILPKFVFLAHVATEMNRSKQDQVAFKHHRLVYCIPTRNIGFQADETFLRVVSLAAVRWLLSN